MIISNNNSKVRFIKKLQNEKPVTLISEIQKIVNFIFGRTLGFFIFMTLIYRKILK